MTKAEMQRDLKLIRKTMRQISSATIDDPDSRRVDWWWNRIKWAICEEADGELRVPCALHRWTGHGCIRLKVTNKNAPAFRDALRELAQEIREAIDNA